MISLLGWTKPLPPHIAAGVSVGVLTVFRMKGFDYLRGEIRNVEFWDFPELKEASSHPKQGFDGIPHWSNEWEHTS